MATTACTTTAGVFTSREAAEHAIAELKAMGYRDDQIGLIAKNTAGQAVRQDGAGTKAEEGAAVGVAIGAAGGAAVGWAIVSGLIPAIGPVIAAGTLGVILANAAGGAAIAGIAGALIGWGMSEEDARYYEGEVRAGNYLVTVECGYGDDARDILQQHGSIDQRQRPI